jgi:hypothetical protein
MMAVTGKVIGGKKLKEFRRRMDRIARGTKTVAIGVQGSDTGKPHPQGRGQTLASILAIHEFGTEDGHVPERAPLRTTTARNRKRWSASFGRGIKAVARGEMTEERMLGLLGAKALADTKIVMRAGLPPPLAENTKARIKGPRAENPTALIDTETLFKSLSWAVRHQGKVKDQGGQDA